MFLGHVALGLAARRVEPRVSLAWWIATVQLVDLIWPILLLAGLERVRIAPGITAFTPLDFYHYPITHSLVGAAVWAIVLALIWFVLHRRTWQATAARRVAMLLALGVLSHWVLDAISHRRDRPVLQGAPYVRLGLCDSL